MCGWHFSLYWARTSSLHTWQAKTTSCHKVVLMVRAGNWLHKDEPLLLQDSQTSVANIHIGARLLPKSCKRRNLTTRVRSIWPVCLAALRHVADTLPKTGFHKSRNHRSGPMQIERFGEHLIGSDLVQTKHDDLANFTWYKRNVAKPYQPDLIIVKVKGSRNRPGVAQRVPGGLGSQISITFGTWRWWGRQPHAPAAFTPRRRSWYSFSLGAESTQGHGTAGRNMSLKNPVTTRNPSRDHPTSSASL
jgi:hypothetical protein